MASVNVKGHVQASRSLSVPSSHNSGGDDIIFKSSHDFQKSVQSGAFDLWGMPSHSSSNSTASADATASSSALLNLLPTDWSIIQSE